MCGVSTTFGIADERVVRPGRCSPTKWSRPAPARWPRLQGGHQGVGVVELGPGRVEVHAPGPHGRELGGADHARRLRGDGSVHGDDVGPLEQLVER